MLFGPLPLEKSGAALAIGGTIASLFECTAAVLQSAVIGPTHIPKELAKRMLLTRGGVKPEALIDLQRL